MARRIRHPAGFLVGGDAFNIPVFGLGNLKTWPEDSVILHDQPSDVLILGLDGQDYVTVTNGEDTTTFQQQDGSISIPSSTFESIVANHGQMTLHKGNQIGGTIYFRPLQESEAFNIVGGLKTDGTVQTQYADSYQTTELIDVKVADHLIYSGRIGYAQFCNIVAYDDNKQVKEVLLKNLDTNRNVRINFDGTIAYVRACVVNTSTYKQLLVYYK